MSAKTRSKSSLNPGAPTIVELTIRGTTALLMHNVRGANPLDKYAKRLAELNRSKKVKGADKEAVLAQMSRVEWECGLYHTATERVDDGLGPYLPARNVLQAIHEAAKMTASGAAVRDGAAYVAAKFPLIYDGPRGVEELYEAGFVHTDLVTVAKAKVLRTRPMFAEWSAVIQFSVLPGMCAPDMFVEFVRAAGMFKGVGDGHKGIYGMGRFEVVSP